jgi:hypothetical protein
MDGIDFFFGCLVTVVIVIMAGCGYMFVSNLHADTVCAKHGYPNSKLTSEGWYCTRIVNQTSEVIRMPND